MTQTDGPAGHRPAAAPAAPGGGGAASDAAAIEASIRAAGDPRRAVSERAYLKSDREFCGASAPAVRRIVTAWCAAQSPDRAADAPADRAADPAAGQAGLPLGHDRLVAVTTRLWERPLFECRRAAVELLRARPGLLTMADVPLIERFLRESGTWALVDDLAGHVMGGLAETHPGQAGAVLDRWARDGDFWLRRSAMLALLVPLRRGDGDFGRFSRYADAMLAEREFFIRKAIGWILRDTARRRPAMIAAWLAPRTHLVSGVTIREAVKPLPPGTRDLLLAGYRGKHPVTLPAQDPDPAP